MNSPFVKVQAGKFGSVLENSTGGVAMFCPRCGVESTDGARFCFKCGEALPGNAAAEVLEPVVIKGVTYTPGTGKYAGYFSGPGGWVTIENFLVKRATPGREPASTGRKIAGWICFAVALVAAIQGVSWLNGFSELDASGNQFAGLLVPLMLGAFAVAAGFIAAGIVLVSGKKRQGF